MQVNIKGTLLSRKLKAPGQGEDFKAHQSLKIMQKVRGEAEIVKVKDFQLETEYKEDSMFDKLCSVMSWSFNGKSGLACSVAM